MNLKLPDADKWLLTSFAALIAPWQEQLSSIELISDYYKPGIQIAASLCGILVGTVSLIIWRSHGIKRIRKKLVVAGVSFLALLLTCLGLSYSVSIFFEPGKIGAVALRLGWPALYLLLNICLSVSIALILLAVMRSRSSN